MKYVNSLKTLEFRHFVYKLPSRLTELDKQGRI